MFTQKNSMDIPKSHNTHFKVFEHFKNRNRMQNDLLTICSWIIKTNGKQNKYGLTGPKLVDFNNILWYARWVDDFFFMKI